MKRLCLKVESSFLNKLQKCLCIREERSSLIYFNRILTYFFFKFYFIGIYGRNVPFLKNYIERLCLKMESSFLNKLQKNVCA